MVRRITVFVLVTVFVALGSSADALRQPSIIGPDSLAQIQLLLDQHRSTIERQDLFQYERTLDRRSLVFQRCMRDFYDLGDVRLQALGANRLLAIEQVSPSMVRGYVEQRNGIAVQYFRHVLTTNILTRPPFDIRTSFVTWYLTQPEPDEVGELRTRTADGVTFTYHAIDERWSEAFAREAVLAHRLVLEHAPDPTSGPQPPLKVSLVPPSEPASLSGLACLLGGRYVAAIDRIFMYRFWLDPSRRQLADASTRTLRHEILHGLQWRSVDRFDTVDWWLREGWPEHVLGASDEYGLIERQMCGEEGTPPSVTELVRGPGPLTTGERHLFLYQAARSLVGHLYRVRPGEAGYWQLARALTDGRSLRDRDYADVVGTSFDELRSDWVERTVADRC